MTWLHRLDRGIGRSRAYLHLQVIMLQHPNLGCHQLYDPTHETLRNLAKRTNALFAEPKSLLLVEGEPHRIVSGTSSNVWQPTSALLLVRATAPRPVLVSRFPNRHQQT